MKPETPILMIALQIPVLPDTSTDQVLNTIGQAVHEALGEIRRQQEEESLETDVQDAFLESAPKETEESYTAETRKDWLEALGYKA